MLRDNHIYRSMPNHTAGIITGCWAFLWPAALRIATHYCAQWNRIAQHLNLSTDLLLACQLAGAAIGDALSIQNIVMVQAVLDEKARERMVLRKLSKMIMIFILLIGATAFVIG